MPRDGSGNYALPSGNPVTTGTLISSSGWANPTMSDLAAALTQSLSRDGQTTPTANLTMGNFRLTNLAAAVQPTDAPTLAQAQTALATWPGVVGTARNVRLLVTSTTAIATLTADEAVVETALGGIPYRLSAINLTVNLSTTGANGMDVGSPPISGYIGLYIIYNPTALTAALLAQNSTSAVLPQVYGGANMPTGYTASGLISIWGTTSGGLFRLGIQRFRRIWFSSINVLAGGASTAWTSLSIAIAVPPGAKSWSGNGSVSFAAAAGNALFVAGDANGTGLQNTVVPVAGSSSGSALADVPIITEQTAFYENTASGGSSNISITSYEF